MAGLVSALFGVDSAWSAQTRYVWFLCDRNSTPAKVWNTDGCAAACLSSRLIRLVISAWLSWARYSMASCRISKDRQCGGAHANRN
jgi:hypothetical protein